MNSKHLSLLIALILMPMSCLALRGDNSNWQCSAYDDNHKQWIVYSKYLRSALNKAKQTCIQKSQLPSSCTVAKEYCEMMVNNQVFRSHWQCTAFDKMGGYWRSDTFQTRNDAIDGAHLICKQQSGFPSSCYVRIMTCKNVSLYNEP